MHFRKCSFAAFGADVPVKGIYAHLDLESEWKGSDKLGRCHNLNSHPFISFHS